MFEPTAANWAGRVLRPGLGFQPVCWGAGFQFDGRGKSFGMVIDPPAFEAIARMRLWNCGDEGFTVPVEPLWVGHYPFQQLMGNKPRHLPTMVWFPLPNLAPGKYLVDIAMLADEQPKPFGVGIYDAQEWSWRAGFMTMAGGRIRPAKLPFGVAWDVGFAPTAPQIVTETHGITIPPARFARYDLLCQDQSGAFHLVLGKDRELDPEEFSAAAPDDMQAKLALYSTADGAELIPIHEWHNGVKCGHEAKHAAWLEYCRMQLPLLLEKLMCGKPISLAGYGDSITSLGSRSPDQLDAPNGPRRDTLRHFEAYGDDWRASVPLFDGHHRLGWNWFLKAAIEKRWGVPVEYHNWGLAGTTSGLGVRNIDGFDYPNAAEPIRLERLLASKPDLVVICVGMNDIGDPIDTKANLISMGNAIRYAGAEMLVVGTPRQNPNFHSRDDLLWQYTHKKVIEAAQELQVAYLPMDQLYGETGAMGLSRQSHCSASFTNHPGARELSAIGQFMSEIIPYRLGSFRSL